MQRTSLRVDMIRRPRVVNNILSKLKINCDFASWGCPAFVHVENLPSHVENFCFAPVFCSNKECGMEINKQDKVHHETEVCEYRKVKCHEIGQIKEIVGRLEENAMELNKIVEAARAETTHKIEVVNEEVRDVKEKVEVARIVSEEVRKEVKDVMENISKVSKDVDEVKVMMNQMLEKLNMLELVNKLPSPREGMTNTRREDILIAGGSGSSGKSTEIYSWEENGWFKISEMNEVHAGASSFIYKDQLFVVGERYSKTVKTMDLNKLPLKWMKFPGQLPFACDDHETVVYQDSWFIRELQLSSPCTIKELCKRPEPRQCHGAEIFEDKVLIMGGENVGGALDGVLEFDVMRNKCKEVPPLPHA